MLEQIKVFHRDSRMSYGAPRIHKDLKAAGEKVSQKPVARLMRQQGLQGRCKRKFKTTKTNPNHNTARNLLEQNFQADAPNQKWVSDITYLPTLEGWLYIAVILDLYSRKMVGWAMSPRMTHDLTLKALAMALKQRTGHSKAGFQGLALHSDKGSQYTSNDFRAELE